MIDGYFELDLVIVDLHMPYLDGRALIDRVRRLGGDTAFKLFLFSATSREELEALGEPGLAAAVFSKLDMLAAQLAHELGRVWPAPWVSRLDELVLESSGGGLSSAGTSMGRRTPRSQWRPKPYLWLSEQREDNARTP